MAFEITPVGYIIMLHKKRSIFRSQSLDNLSTGPDVKLPLFALRIGIEGSRKRPFGRGHLALQPADRLGGALAEQGVAGLGKSQRQQFQKLSVVVEHFLEMRHQPALVDRIARETAAEVVVNAALADALQRVFDQLEKPFVAAAQP